MPLSAKYGGTWRDVPKARAFVKDAGVWKNPKQIWVKRAGVWQPTYTGDPYFDNVAMLLHFDGAEGGTVFTDSSKWNRALQVAGTIKTTLTDSVFGGSSARLDGGDALRPNANAGAELTIGTQPYTVEFFVKRQGSGLQVIFETRSGSQTGMYVGFNTSPANTIQVGGAGTARNTSLVLATTTWYHVAVSRTAGTARIFVDGTQLLSWSDSVNIAGSASRPNIGLNVSNSNGLNGFLDEFRLTIGVGRYTANFARPTEPFPDST